MGIGDSHSLSGMNVGASQSGTSGGSASPGVDASAGADAGAGMLVWMPALVAFWPWAGSALPGLLRARLVGWASVDLLRAALPVTTPTSGASRSTRSCLCASMMDRGAALRLLLFMHLRCSEIASLVRIVLSSFTVLHSCKIGITWRRCQEMVMLAQYEFSCSPLSCAGIKA
jgi:hypothetical protein